MRGFAGRTYTVIRDFNFRTTPYRLYRFAIFPGIIRVKILPVPGLLMIYDLWKLVDLEFLIFWRVRIVKSPLLERDISADKI